MRIDPHAVVDVSKLKAALRAYPHKKKKKRERKREKIINKKQYAWSF